MQLTYQVDQEDLALVRSKLEGLRRTAPRLLQNVINRVATSTRRELADGARESYTVKRPDFNRHTQLFRASPGNLEATIRAEGKTLSMGDFKIASRKTGPAAADIVKTGLKDIVSSSGIKAFTFPSKKGRAVLVAQRTGKARLPIKVFRSVSVPKMLEMIYKGERGGLEGAMGPLIQKKLHDEIVKELKKIG